jgi:hypothetical protein
MNQHNGKPTRKQQKLRKEYNAIQFERLKDNSRKLMEGYGKAAEIVKQEEAEVHGSRRVIRYASVAIFILTAAGLAFALFLFWGLLSDR